MQHSLSGEQLGLDACPHLGRRVTDKRQVVEREGRSVIHMQIVRRVGGRTEQGVVHDALNAAQKFPGNYQPRVCVLRLGVPYMDHG